ncbi:unnamed protein product, partial [Adineta steineri]
PDENDENDYDNDENDQIQDPETLIKHQKYATRLYIPLFIITIYILFFIALINPQTQTITVPNITPILFDQLYHEYGETLSCPCKNTSIFYETFVTTEISFHPVCSSIFISKEWIQSLYHPYASAFLVMDFRTTASSQVNQDVFS